VTNRVPLLSKNEMDPELLNLAAYKRGGQEEPFNIYRTLAHHPRMVREWLQFADSIRFNAKLSSRDRELLILRTGVNCKCEYEWGQHVPYAREAGMSEDEINAIVRPISSWDWSEKDIVLLEVADELHMSSNINESLWKLLSAHFQNDELVEIIMLVGQYHLVSFVLNGFSVERDAGLVPFPSDFAK
jgi:4-carboxymuconolactone decarboxylase